MKNPWFEKATSTNKKILKERKTLESKVKNLLTNIEERKGLETVENWTKEYLSKKKKA